MRLALLPICFAGLPLCAQWDVRLELPRPTGQNLPQTLISGTGNLVAGDFNTGQGYIATVSRQLLQVGPLLKLEGGVEYSQFTTGGSLVNGTASQGTSLRQQGVGVDLNAQIWVPFTGIAGELGLIQRFQRYTFDTAGASNAKDLSRTWLRVGTRWRIPSVVVHPYAGRQLPAARHQGPPREAQQRRGSGDLLHRPGQRTGVPAPVDLRRGRGLLMFRRVLPSLLLAPVLAAASSTQARPKLVVVIVVDQFSTELMQTYGPELTGGLARLRKEGVFFTEAYHDHGFTETGPGHSVLLSGRFPAHTGIVENRWLDRATGKFVYCVEDAAAKSLTVPGQASASNARFLGDGLGDWLQAQIPGSRVYALSGKDRAAILMAGRQPTGVYWFTGPAGSAVPRPTPRICPRGWCSYDQGLSSRITTDSWLWWKDPATPEGRSAQWTFGSVTVRNGGLPRLIQGAGMPLDRGFDVRFRKSPFLDAVTLEAAEALLDGEHLGRGPGTDLLAISFSATDYIGHNYGTLGTEMRDQIHRLDRGLGRLLDRLRQQHPGAWVVLSADHGGLDIPEALSDQGFPARRLLAGPFMAALQADLRGTFKVDRDLLVPTTEPNTLYLDESALKATSLDPPRSPSTGPVLAARPPRGRRGFHRRGAPWPRTLRPPAAPGTAASARCCAAASAPSAAATSSWR